MLLLIDAGNTLVKWAVPEHAMQPPAYPGAVRWRHSGVVASADLAQLAQAWQGMDIRGVMLSNVAGAALGDGLLALLFSVFGRQVPIAWFASVPELAGVRNGYRNPAQLGCDRFAAAIGAHALFPRQALIVATCGTATTIDALTAAGKFVGGMILPGLGLMASALARNTAQLPKIEKIDPFSTPFADNTSDAIGSGCIAAQAGAIERAVAAHRAQQGSVLCVLAGGAASMLLNYLAVPCEKVDNLVLIGLHVAAAELNQPFTVFPLC